MRLRLPLLLLSLIAVAAPGARADDPPEVSLAFLGDRYDPAELPVPAGIKFVLRLQNKSNVSSEWESIALHREKVVPAGSSATIYIGPLRPGVYEFFDDFQPKVRGNLVAR